MAESVSLLPLLYILLLTPPLDPSFLALLVHWDIKTEIRSRNVFDVNWSTISCVLQKKKKKYVRHVGVHLDISLHRKSTTRGPGRKAQLLKSPGTFQRLGM